MSDKSKLTFRELLERSRVCDDAARQLIDQYGAHLKLVIRKRMEPAIRQRIGSSDVCQQVWMSWLTSSCVPPTPRQLRTLLSAIARRRLVDAQRKHFASKRGIQKENNADYEPFTSTDTPSGVAIAKETLDQLCEQAGSRSQVVELKRLGYSIKDIATRLGLSQSTVRRQLEALK